MRIITAFMTSYINRKKITHFVVIPRLSFVKTLVEEYIKENPDITKLELKINIKKVDM